MNVIEFLHVENFASIDIHRCLLTFYGDQIVNVKTVRWWVLLFSSANCSVRDKLHSAWYVEFDEDGMQS